MHVVVVRSLNQNVILLHQENSELTMTVMRNFLLGKNPTVALFVVVVRRMIQTEIDRTLVVVVWACSTCDMSPRESKEKLIVVVSSI